MRRYVRTGLLDAVLVRPLGALPQLLLLDLPLRRLGRVVLGRGRARGRAAPAPTSTGRPARVALLVVAPLAGAVFFGAIFVATATVAFWWIESGELANALTYGGRDFTSYPITVYGGWFRARLRVRAGVRASSAYYPALALLGRADPLGAAGLAGLGLAGWSRGRRRGWPPLVWRIGVRHYRSTGS